VQFEHPVQEATRLDYLHEVDHAVGRIERLERAIDEAVKTALPCMRGVIEALQALRGIALVSAGPVGLASRRICGPVIPLIADLLRNQDRNGDHSPLCRWYTSRDSISSVRAGQPHERTAYDNVGLCPNRKSG
jgi:hypothetical protein